MATYDFDHMNDLKKTPPQPAVSDIANVIPERLLREARKIELIEGSSLFLAGDKVRNAYVVVSGEVRLVRMGRGGSEITLQRSRGGFIAEASLDSKVYHCDAIASARSELLAFPVVAFKSALANDTAFCSRWQSILAAEVRKLRAQCERLGLKTAEERIIHFIEAEGKDGVVVLPLNKKAWATDLGLTHEALYRALKRLRDNNVVWTEGLEVGLCP